MYKNYTTTGQLVLPMDIEVLIPENHIDLAVEKLNSNLLSSPHQGGDLSHHRIEESIDNQPLKCSKCDKEIIDEWEYHDNDGVCDDCYYTLVKKGLLC